MLLINKGLSIMSPILSTFAAFAGSHFIARTADQGLAHTLGLATLRHGTNPLFWLSIHTVGFMPSMGGSKCGGDAVLRVHPQNNNHVFFAADADDYRGVNNLKTFLISKIQMRFLPRYFCQTSCQGLLNQIGLLPKIKHSDDKMLTVIKFTVLFLLTAGSQAIPTIKVRLDSEKAKKLSKDYTIDNDWAVYTDEWVSPLNIGLAGTLWNGLSYKVVKRTYEKPARFIAGVALIAISAYAGIHLLPSAIVAHKVAVIAGVALAII